MTISVRLSSILAAITLVSLAPAQAADTCDTLTVRMIRATGASLAGRVGSRAVFRAADAERMSLDCRAPRRMVLIAREREPSRRFYELIGDAAQALTGASAEAAETLALVLHQEALVTGRPQQGTTRRVAIRCETASDADPFAGLRTRCILAPLPVPHAKPVLRRRADLFVGTTAG
ncbi:hypothetical protein [Methylobacterium sp. 37f]|uniref:hypothetical protein n=1 Tax=Methylobacterium sp. 37f TaxID=2817058 RepID=UPI001FFC5367|nr:hypothetical protein [Methylobacterium sp. 37f]MCK2054731.1 hypothetical protein [Methylobacterium sp. 37f]